MGWSGLATVWITPYYVGVTLGILFELILIVAMTFLTTIT